jgi:hypothetical protein
LGTSFSLNLSANQAGVQFQGIDHAVMSHVCNIINSTGSNIETVVRDHYSSNGYWLPIISRRKMFAYLASFSIEPRADMGLLLLSMYLTLRPPDLLGNSQQQHIYTETKHLLCFIQSANILSTEVVQANILISIYEYGQCLTRSSYLSIGTCARMTQALGWRSPSEADEQKLLSVEVFAAAEERRRTWWGILVVDSLSVLELMSTGVSVDTLSPAFGIVGQHFELPGNDEGWDECEESGESENPNTGTARILARSAKLLDSVLSHVRNPPKEQSIVEQQVRDLTEALMEHAIFAVESGLGKWGSHCGALSLNNK